MTTRTAQVTRNWCTDGKHFVPVSEFYTYVNRSGRTVLQSHCKDCRRASKKAAKAERKKADDGRKLRAWRPPSGERHHHSKVTDAQREEILRRWQEPSRIVARDYGISAGRVRQMWSGL